MGRLRGFSSDKVVEPLVERGKEDEQGGLRNIKFELRGYRFGSVNLLKFAGCPVDD